MSYTLDDVAKRRRRVRFHLSAKRFEAKRPFINPLACPRMTCLPVDDRNVGARNGWTKVGSSPYIDFVDYPTNYIETNVHNDEIGDFTFEDLPSGTPSTVEIAIYNRWATSGNDRVEVWMWESVGGWAKAGDITPASGWQWTRFDVSAKFNTRTKLNEAQMYLKYIEV